MIKASAVIPVFNGEKYIEKAVDSILSQTFEDIEIVIVDDASTDRTKEIILDRFGSLIGNRIIYFRNDHTRERAFNRNKGHELSSGEIVFFHDHDDEWDNTYVEEMVDFFGKEKCDIAYSFQRTFINSNSEVTRVSKKNMPSDTVRAIFSSAVGYPTATAFKSSSFPSYSDRHIPREDWEIFIRAYLSGLKISIIDNNKVKIRAHPERTSKKMFFWSSTLKVLNDYKDKVPKQELAGFLFHAGEVCLRFGDIFRGWRLVARAVKEQPRILMDSRTAVSIAKRSLRIDKYLQGYSERKELNRGVFNNQD